MMLVEKMWSEDLLDVIFNSGYDIRIHAIQTALSLILRRSSNLSQRMGGVDFSPRVFGIYDSETEDCIKSYQKAVGLSETGKLDPQTYMSIFLNLRKELNSTIIKDGPRSIKICDVGSIKGIDEYDEDDIDINFVNKIEDTFEGGVENVNTEDIIKDALMLSNPAIFDSGKLYSKIKDTLNEYINDKFSDTNGGKIYGDSPNFSEGTVNERYASPSFSKRILSGHAYNTPSFGHGGYREGIDSPSYTNVTNDNDNDYIGNLLSNSIYEGNFDYSRPIVWNSNSSMNIDVGGFVYDKSSKYETFFSEKNTSPTRRSEYDITIVYGTNGQFAKQLLSVRPRAKSQQLDASGEAIYDVIEFIAKDIVETNNIRR